MFGRYLTELFATPERILLVLILVIVLGGWLTNKDRD